MSLGPGTCQKSLKILTKYHYLVMLQGPYCIPVWHGTNKSRVLARTLYRKRIGVVLNTKSILKYQPISRREAGP